MSFICVPNVKKIETWEGYDLNIFIILCEGEEKCEENQAIFGTNISRSAEAISFNFDM